MVVEPIAAKLPALEPDVLAYFKDQRGVFGAMNLLPDHLPSDVRVAEIVRNVMTVDYGIARAFEVPTYHDYLERFVAESKRACGTTNPGDCVRESYGTHFETLQRSSDRELAERIRAAAADSMETFNLFLPKQCNLSCRGCYAAAVPVTSQPYDDELVTDFYTGAERIIAQARGCGARTVYTSGDGEPTLFPRFFDLLDLLRRNGMQWLFFTAGLAFSSETAAVYTWETARRWLQGPSRDRIASQLSANLADGRPDPTVRALCAELAHYRESVQVYHSLWSTDGETNTAMRRPVQGAYQYRTVHSRGSTLTLPSSLVTMMDEIFTGSLRSRFGVEMPVSDVGVDQVPAMAAFVVDNQLRSYFEPTIFTGRNRIGDLGEAPPAAVAAMAPLLVRTQCGFRNIHQPTVKYHHRAPDRTFLASPGMGVDAADLRSMGVLDSLVISGRADGFFAAVHSPLMVYANYVHITGCKCNDFAAELVRNRAAITARWQEIVSVVPTRDLGVEAIADRLLAGARK
jgi:organic radical activating enzyme